jgi:SPP1 family predicted phage head-tail adaptor
MQKSSRRHLVIVQQKTPATDQDGGQIFTWSEFAKAWARIRMLRGRDFIAASAAHNEMIGVFNIAYRAGVTQDMRISYDGKYYDITAVVDVNEQRRELDIMVRTGASEG